MKQNTKGKRMYDDLLKGGWGQFIYSQAPKMILLFSVVDITNGILSIWKMTIFNSCHWCAFMNFT